MKPKVVSFDDASETHREIEGYEHCIRVRFQEPFIEQPAEDVTEDNQELWDEWYASDEYERARDQYNREALIEVFGDLAPQDLIFDWRDEQEVWLRYNIGESFPIV